MERESAFARVSKYRSHPFACIHTIINHLCYAYFCSFPKPLGAPGRPLADRLTCWLNHGMSLSDGKWARSFHRAISHFLLKVQLFAEMHFLQRIHFFLTSVLLAKKHILRKTHSEKGIRCIDLNSIPRGKTI